MIISKNIIMLVTLICACISSTVYSGESEQLKRDIQFEVSQSEKWVEGRGSPTDDKYVAVIFIKKPGSVLTNPSGSWGILHSVFNGHISEAQQKRNNKGHFITGVLSDSIIQLEMPEGSQEFCLHGVSLEDTKIMVELLIKWADDQAYAKLTKVKNKLKECRENQSIIEKEITELEQTEKEIAVKLDEAKTLVPYQSVNDAQICIQEFNKVSQLIEIEIVGIQAKLDMVKQQEKLVQNAKNTESKRVSDLLFEIRLSQEIDLAGAMARKYAVGDALKKAFDFQSMAEKAEEITNTLKEKQGILSKHQFSIVKLEETIANPPVEMKAVEIVDNKVIIYPVIFVNRR